MNGLQQKMPLKPKRPCSKIGCNNLTRERYCEAHKQEQNQYDRNRGSAASRGYDSKWRKYRIAFLAKHPLCVECQKIGIVRAATVVDHITPHKGNKILFWDKNNHQPLCASCHSAKTAREDGGWGNARKRSENEM